MGENNVVDAVIGFAVLKGWIWRKIAYRGRHGAPDVMFIRNGVVVFVEFKDIGKCLNPHQVRERARLLAAGARAFEVRSVREGIALFERLDAKEV